jgi:hypothetical protein
MVALLGRIWFDRIVPAETRLNSEEPSRYDADVPVPADWPPQAAMPEEAGIEEDEDLYERLRGWGLEVARENQLPPYVVFHNAVLRRTAARRPATLDELEAIRGIGPKKREAYGHPVLAIGGVREAARIRAREVPRDPAPVLVLLRFWVQQRYLPARADR